MELHVLRGAEKTMSAGRIALVHAEVLLVPLYEGQAFFPEIYEYLQRFGYRLVNFYDCSYSSERYLAWADALFMRPDVLAHRLKNLRQQSRAR